MSIKAFDYDVNVHGAQVLVQTQPLHPRCASDGEIDANINALKDNLDAVGKRMKATLRKQKLKPDFF